MKIEKLEKLSCLKIDELQKPYILRSLEGVMTMLHEIEGIENPKISETKYEKTHFRDAVTIVPEKTSLHLEGGLFLAPKVIKKD